MPDTPHEQKFGHIWAPLPVDDSALPPEAFESDDDSPIRGGSKIDKRFGAAANHPSLASPIRMDLLHSGEAYVRCIKKQGDIPGYEYKRGDQGIGYYRVEGVGPPHKKPAAGSSTGQANRGRNQNMGSGAADVFGGGGHLTGAWGGADNSVARKSGGRQGLGQGGNDNAGGKYKSTSLW